MFLLQSFSSDSGNLSELRFLSEIALPSGWCPGDREVSVFEHADVGLRGLDSDPPRLSLLKLLEEILPDGERSCGGENSGFTCSVFCVGYLDGLNSAPSLAVLSVFLAQSFPDGWWILGGGASEAPPILVVVFNFH